MFPIEILSTTPRILGSIRSAAEALNEVQAEFRFVVASPELQEHAELLQRERYHTGEIWGWLEEYRELARGHRLFVLLVVDGPLQSASLGNIFGSHKAHLGLAIITVDGFSLFVKDLVRYLAYYFVRYALSFLAPDIKNHTDPSRKACFFHKKMNEIEIKESLQSGMICDPDRSLLHDVWTPSIKSAVEAMTKHVARIDPHALVLKGGGVKGLAFTGALSVLEEYVSFDTFAGTSAGAIGASLLAAGFTATELAEELMALDFRQFKDAGRLAAIWNLMTRQGLFPGRTIRSWLDRMLDRKLDNHESRMSDLPNRAVVYACSPKGLVVFDSQGERSDEPVSFAVRCSMSIPYYFIAPRLSGRRVFDGGLRHNFPLGHFAERNQGKRFIGLYLEPPRTAGPRWQIRDIVDAAVSADEPAALREHRNRIVSINTDPIRTTDFDITESEKQFLVESGRVGGLQFLHENKWENAPTEEAIQEAEACLERARLVIAKSRRRRAL